LCPGAEYGPAKRWPTHHFADLAREKIQSGFQVWIMGSQKDNDIAEQIHARVSSPHCYNLTGKTSLADAIDLMACGALVVSNDSGLMHMAAALQKPLIAIYGSSHAGFTPPLSEHVKILSLNLSCSPCFARTCPLEHLRCLNDLSPQQVLSAMESLMPLETCS
jgi:heptosyltransferase-2